MKLNKLLLLGSISLLMAMPVAAQKQYQSHMWEISGNGLSKPSYIFGTMHVSKKVAFHLGDPFYDAISNCDYVALELEPDIWMHDMFTGDYLKKMIGSLARRGNSYGNYGSSFSGTMKLELDAEKRIEEFLKSSSNFTNFMLFRSNAGNQDYEEGSWLDMHIYQCAKKLNKKSFGLETFQSSMDNAEKAQKEQMKDKDYFQNYQKRIELENQMEGAYRRGDLNFVDSLSHLSYPGESYKYMLTERNKNFVHTMDSLMKHGNLFAAMGCAHLPGQDGVIEMLRAMGYTVEPADKGTRDAKRKAEIEKKLLVRPLNKYTSKDGAISFDSPAEVFSMSSENAGILYLTMDLPNSGNFLVQRSAWQPILLNLSREELISKMEVLLYEKLAGEIVSQKKIIINGQPAFDVMHKSATGDYVRTQIILLNNELIRLELSARGDMVKKGYGKYFFDSFKLNVNAEAKTVKNLYHGTMAISAPGNMVEYKSELDFNFTGMIPVVIEDQLSKTVTIISRGTMRDPDFIDENNYELNAFVRYFFDNTEFENNIKPEGQNKDKKAIRSSYKGYNERQTYTLFFANGFDYYAVQVMNDDSLEAEKIFSSMQLTEKPQEEFSLMTDSLHLFTAKVPWKVDEKEGKKSNNPFSLWGADNEDEDKKDIGEEFERYTAVEHPEGGKVIEINTHRFDKYAKLNGKAELQKDLENDITSQGDYTIKQRSVQWDNNNMVAEYLLTDTNCMRGHRVKYLLNNMVSYTIRYADDTTLLYNPYVNTFFQTFAPIADSVSNGNNPFSSKYHQWILDMQSTDTTVYNFAQRSSWQNSADTKQDLMDLKTLSTQLSPLADEETKEMYQNKWHDYLYIDKSKENIQWLKNEYLQHPDSADYQAQILSNLSYMTTTESLATFKELLLKETPLVEYPDFLNGLRDSLELTGKIIMALMPLTEFEEYKLNIYGLLATCVDSAAIKPTAYSAHVASILREAKLELKRTSSNENSSSGSDSYDYEDSYYSTLSIYLTLLHTYKSQADVALLFKQVDESKKEAVILENALYLTGMKKKLSDTQAKLLIKEDEPATTYYNLKNVERLDLYPAKWDIEKELALQEIKDYTEYNSDYTSLPEKVDTVEIINDYYGYMKSRKFHVYNIRYRMPNKEEWKHAVVALERYGKNSDNYELLVRYEKNKDEDGGFSMFGGNSSTEKEKEKTEEEIFEELWLDMNQEERVKSNGPSNYIDEVSWE